MAKSAKNSATRLERLRPGKLISERELTLELLGKRLKAEGMTLSFDGDGDLYVSDAMLGHPFWVMLNRVNKVVVLHACQDYATECGALEALEAAQRLRLGPLTPQFFLQDHSLYLHYFLSYHDHLVVSHVYEAACRFAEYAANMPARDANASARVMH